MAEKENVFSDAKIADDEFDKLLVRNYSNRPNQKSAYGPGLNATQTKDIFDAAAIHIKEKHNMLIEGIEHVGAAEAERQAEFEQNEAKRKTDFETAESERANLFIQSQSERDSKWSEELANRQEVFDNFFNSLEIITEPEEIDPKVMSEETTKKYVKKYSEEYIPKVATRNLANLTFEQAMIDGGNFKVNTTFQSYTASPDYIAVSGGESYTISCEYGSVYGLIYIHEYSADNEDSFIKYTRMGNINGSSMPVTIQFDANCAFIRIHVYAPTAPTTWKELIPNKLQIELGTVATNYIKPLVIDCDEIDAEELGKRMQESGAIPNTDGYIDTLPSTEQLPASAWEYGVLKNEDGSETTVNPVEIRVRTKGYIQLHKGDKVIDTQTGINVFEYDPITLEHLSNAGAWIKEYTVQNDSFVRILVNNASKADMETVASRVTITNNSNSRIKFIALPLDEMREWTDRLIDEKAEKDYVTKTKFSAVKNTLLKQSAHRGYRGTGAPQCTAPAYIEAKKYGYDVGENDMWVTTDGVFVMAHNTTLPSDSSIVIAESTYETLYAGNMGTFNGKEVKIMTLEEWLILMKKIGLEPFVDIKSNLTAEQAAAAVAIARKHGMLDKMTWCKGASDTIRGIRAAYPKAKIALLGATTVYPEFVIEDRPDLTVLYPQSINVTAEVVENAHNAGVGIECWHCDYSLYGFDTEEEILAEVERVVELGVTGICLDTYLPSEYFVEKLNAEWGLE